MLSEIKMEEKRSETSQILEIVRNIQKRMVKLENDNFVMLRRLQDIRTMTSRSNADLKKGLEACQKGFLMNCSAQYELREELSDHCGTMIDHGNDIDFGGRVHTV